MKKNGFTALELLIATSILTFIIAGMTIALQQQQRQFNITKEAVDIDLEGRTILDFISTEIRNASARQGKSFSLDFVNGGGVSSNSQRCDLDSVQSDFTTPSGSLDSPPDCLTVYTWDISRGMTNAVNNQNLPSISDNITINSSASGSLVLSLPDNWFDGTNLIGETTSNVRTLIGVRSRATLCNPNPAIDCLANPENCTECSIILEGDVSGSLKTITIDDVGDIIIENFPVDFTSISELINGKNDSVFSRTYGFINNFSALASELTLAQSKMFRVDPRKRELQMSVNGGAFIPIAGGQLETPDGLETPGIVDLQFVFNLRNPDGSFTKVGHCEGSSCNDTAKNIYNDFTQNAVLGLQHNIRSVEIYLVVKSKTKPRNLRGGMYEQTIPEIGDVLERTVTNQSDLKEPEEGFLYRLHTTTVYPRNYGREEFG